MERVPAGRRLPSLPALDGIRAVAVAAVLLYHADLRWLPGGFLGVEVFFVLSGYLITALLWSEVREHGRVSLRAFWHRRARRLLPALFVMLGVVAVTFVLGWPGEVARIRGELAAAFGYVSNWYLIGTDHSYFSTIGRPSPFGHLWSLAIEEQFYLLWPVIFGVIAARVRRPGRLAAGILAAAIGSAVALALLYTSGDPSRVYYGTDTRAAGLLLGAALAVAWRPFEGHGPRVRASVLDAAVLASGGYLVWAFMRADGFSSFTYVPGIHLVALATAVLIAAGVHPASRLARALGWAPLRALGHRSYAIYLWHWPVFVVTRPEIDLLAGRWMTLGLRIVLTLLLAELSYRLIEEPIRGGAIGRIVRRVRGRARWAPEAIRQAAYGWSAIGTVLIVSAAMLTVAIVRAPNTVASALQRDRVEHAVIVPLPDRAVGDQARVELPPRVVPEPRKTARAVGTPTRSRQPIPSVPRVKADVVSVGDSVMLGARAMLPKQIKGIYIDAAVSRHVHDGLGVLRELRRAEGLGEIVVVHLGNNGSFTDAQFDDMMHILRGVSQVLVVNVKVPRSWESAVNTTIARGVRRHASTTLVDWHMRWRDCRGDVFEGDGYHLTADGARCYSALIAAAL